jgi:hypothetical protein
LAVETLGELQFTSRGLGLETNMIPILMHQMRMSTNNVSSVISLLSGTQAKKVGNPKKKPYNRAEKPNI